MNNIDEQYKVPLIAKLLHSLPHYNITFHRTNNTFRPTDEVYLEVICPKKKKIKRNHPIFYPFWFPRCLWCAECRQHTCTNT